MFSNALFVLLWLALAAFLVNRLYVGIKHGELNVKGAIYSRSSSAVQFWLSMTFAAIALGLSTLVLVALLGP